MGRIFLIIAGLIVINSWSLDIQKYVQKAKNGDVHSMAYLGQNYYAGDVIQQDLEKAFRWLHAAASGGNNSAKNWLSKMYFQGDGVEKNYLASYKWALLAKKSGDKQSVNIVKFLEPKIEFYTKARYEDLKNTSVEKKAFGFILGDVFPDELVNEDQYYDDYAQIHTNHANIRYVLKKVNPKYATKRDKITNKITAFLTPVSHTLYKIKAHAEFDTTQQCKNHMNGYMKRLGARNVKTEKDSYGVVLKYVDFGVKKSPTLPNRQEIITGIDNLQGIRHSTKCSGVFGTVMVEDFASKELAIAEAIEKEPFFESYFGKDIGVKANYMSPFGFNLLKPYRDKRVKFNDYYKVKPINPSSLFQDYIVKTSVLTNTLYEIIATGKFRNKERCMFSIGTTINKFISQYKNKNYKDEQYWYKNYGGFTSSFYINENGIAQSSKASKEAVYIRMGCDNANNDGWKGWINMKSLFGEKINRFEEKLMIEERL